ncbi:hypothetical protein M0811_07222 [Anaeramoeba ignava]|uniref:Uncharacterized protein n=1 Tax=Anaeramoeba ignava TaxID=1746090 RepID=A0A9Q0LMQ7_ANAIG|nr:hypothetical protein M0811_07222 [Anaeramoeba ignava]
MPSWFLNFTFYSSNSPFYFHLHNTILPFISSIVPSILHLIHHLISIIIISLSVPSASPFRHFSISILDSSIGIIPSFTIPSASQSPLTFTIIIHNTSKISISINILHRHHQYSISIHHQYSHISIFQYFTIYSHFILFIINIYIRPSIFHHHNIHHFFAL